MSRTTRFKILGPLCLVGGLVTAAVGFNERAGGSCRLRFEGVNVPARALGLDTVRGQSGNKSHTIFAEYSTREGDRIVRKVFPVSTRVLEASRKGGAIRVRYLPSDPQISEIEGDASGFSEALVTGLVMALIGAALTAFAYRKRPASSP